MTNLEKIKKAWSMGWAAVIENRGTVVMVSQRVPAIAYRTEADNIMAFPSESFELCEITGYKYAGELAGDEDIPKGQKFKRINGNAIWEFVAKKDVGTLILDGGDVSQLEFHQSEIEPYFE